MPEEREFTFTLSVSEKSYQCKPTQEEAKYITYRPKTITIDDLENLTKQGYAFCYLFKTNAEILKQYEKKIEKFLSTNSIFCDMDDMPIEMCSYIANLPFKPTIGYTTYSNGKDGKYSYRLIYLFHDSITSTFDFTSIYTAIAEANHFETYVDENGKDFGFDYRPVNQCYYGGGANSEIYKSYYVYDTSIFTVLSNSTLSNTSSIIDNFPFKNNNRICSDTYYSQMEKEVLKDFKRLSPKDFLYKYESQFDKDYFRSLSTERILSDDKICYYYPEEYYTVPRHWLYEDGKHYVGKWRTGQDRKNKLYISAQIIKKNNPNLSFACLLYCLVKERFFYYENKDGKINNDVLFTIAENAFKYKANLRSSKHPYFSVNKEYWNEQGISANQAKQFIRRIRTDEQIYKNYDCTLSIKENLILFKERGIKVGKSSLYNFLNRYNFPFKNNNRRICNTYYSQMEILSVNDILLILKGDINYHFDMTLQKEYIDAT